VSTADTNRPDTRPRFRTQLRTADTAAASLSAATRTPPADCGVRGGLRPAAVGPWQTRSQLSQRNGSRRDNRACWSALANRARSASSVDTNDPDGGHHDPGVRKADAACGHRQPAARGTAGYPRLRQRGADTVASCAAPSSPRAGSGQLGQGPGRQPGPLAPRPRQGWLRWLRNQRDHKLRQASRAHPARAGPCPTGWPVTIPDRRRRRSPSWASAAAALGRRQR
jgi:hypothetical protein